MKFQYSLICLSALVSTQNGSYINSNTVQKGYGNNSSTSISHKDFGFGLNGSKNINANTAQYGVGNSSSTAINSRSGNSGFPSVPFGVPRTLRPVGRPILY